MQLLEIKNLSVRVGAKEVVRNLFLQIGEGEIHALMGPNGSGKSSLSLALAGHPNYAVTEGGVTLDGTNLLGLVPEKRAEAGLFLSFQEPPEVGGVTMRTFLTMIGSGREANYAGLEKMLPEIGLHDSFLSKFVNDGFSGGEKKKSELLQLISRRPKVAICDEIDSGLDIDALRGVARVLGAEAERGAGLLLISHSPRLFDLVPPDFVHILLKGRLAASGGTEVLRRLEEKGYNVFE